MNAIKLFHENALKHPSKMAIADIKHGVLSFEDILKLSSQVQALITDLKISKDDSVLVAIPPSPVLYGVLCGLMGLGVRIIFIEPWLSLDRIDHIIKTTRPKAFLTSTLGKLWGMRSQAIRKIPYWVTPKDILNARTTSFQTEDLDETHHAFIVFSSGTTGAPKGVVRTHAYMQNIYDIFVTLEPQNFNSPDLIIFPNVALFHLATGRGSVIVPHKWSKQNLEKVLQLCEKFKPQTLSTGPSFIKRLLDEDLFQKFNSLERLVIGGALTDCWIIQKVISKRPDCRLLHIYGGSEAEPVALIDAKLALEKSLEKGYFQTLCLGEVIPQLDYKLDNQILWVSGPNVAGEYIGDAKENEGIKYRDKDGKLWHCMGDRVQAEDGLLWFSGRETQNKTDFILEQKIYSYLQTSKCFLHRISENNLILIGEGIKNRFSELKDKFPEIESFEEFKIIRDKRHRSRIDRKKSLPKSLRINEMNKLKKISTYLKERSPLPAITFLSAGIGVSAMAAKEGFNLTLFLISIVLNNFLFIQMRLADEIKDFETDKVINPTRPLPRGLFTTTEVLKLLIGIFSILILSSLAVTFIYSPLGGVSLLVASIFSWLMFKEFYISHQLDKSPMFYALTHQVIVFPLFAWVGLAYDSTLIHNHLFQGWLLANFGASFTFEICRKLDPRAHVLAKTYAHHYGRNKTVGLCLIFLIISAIGAIWAGFAAYSIPALCLLLLGLLAWRSNPEKYKLPAGLSALSSAIILWSPAIMWLLRSWSNK